MYENDDSLKRTEEMIPRIQYTDPVLMFGSIATMTCAHGWQ